MTRTVLFVCTGNTCRSPLAEQLFAKLSREAGLAWTASSAGTRAAAGMPLSRGAAAVFAARGFDPDAHRSRPVDAALLDAADAVYTMERAQRDLLAKRFPRHAAKIAVLRDGADIEDPVGGDAAAFEKSAAAIEEAVRAIVRNERETHAQNTR